MAFSFLRNALRCSQSFAKYGILRSTLDNIKMDSTRNALIAACNRCAARTTLNVMLLTRDYSKQAKTHADRKYESSSESDSDLEFGKRGESEFWRRKMRTFHAILDLNKDGVVAFDDFKLLAQRFVNLGHLSDKHTKEFYCLIEDLWEKQFGEMSPYNLVSVEKFLENTHHVLNDKKLVRRAHSFLPYLFKAVDKDKSGEITVEEFKLFFDVLGLKEVDAVLAFRAIDSNGDGRISNKEFVKHGRDFFLSEDEENLSKYFWGPLVEQ